MPRTAPSPKPKHAPHACQHPEHHVHGPDQYVREVERACIERGLRLTPIRAQVLRLVADAGRPVKAYDLLDQMKLTREGAAPPTVYRALDFLVEQGFVHRLASINAFVGCHHPREAQHQAPFLICDGCQTAVELEDPSIAAQLEAQARALGFQPAAQTLEVHGLCARCSG